MFTKHSEQKHTSSSILSTCVDAGFWAGKMFETPSRWLYKQLLIRDAYEWRSVLALEPRIVGVLSVLGSHEFYDQTIFIVRPKVPAFSYRSEWPKIVRFLDQTSAHLVTADDVRVANERGELLDKKFFAQDLPKLPPNAETASELISEAV